MAPRSEADMKKWSQLVAQAWADDSLKRRLVQNPASVLREHGIQMQPGIEVRVVEDTANVTHFVLPAKPAGDVTELNEMELSEVVGGMGVVCHVTKDFPEDSFKPLFIQGSKAL
jgi:hypothetical protein